MPKIRYNCKKENAVCIVTGYPLNCNQDGIRLVIDQDKGVVPDINQDLGASQAVWVTCNKSILTEAIEKHMLSQTGDHVFVDPLLPEKIERLLKKKALYMLSIARKAGQMVSGYDKVRSILKEDKAKLLIQASDGSIDNKAKLQLIARDITVIDIFSSEELGLALGHCNIVHVAVRKGNLADKLLDEIIRLYNYYGRSIDVYKA